jgi:hypothetical protein
MRIHPLEVTVLTRRAGVPVSQPSAFRLPDFYGPVAISSGADQAGRLCYESSARAAPLGFPDQRGASASPCVSRRRAMGEWSDCMVDQALLQKYSRLVAGQRAYFKAGKTRHADWRMEQLHGVIRMIDESRDAMYDALWDDLRRNQVEADLMDVEYNIREARYALDHLEGWMEPKREYTPILMKPGHVWVRRDPLGVTLIIGAWNEPYMLTLAPLVAAVVAEHRGAQAVGDLRSVRSADRRDGVELSRSRGRCGRAGGHSRDHCSAGREVGLDLFHRQPLCGQDRSPSGSAKSHTCGARTWR